MLLVLIKTKVVQTAIISRWVCKTSQSILHEWNIVVRTIVGIKFTTQGAANGRSIDTSIVVTIETNIGIVRSTITCCSTSIEINTVIAINVGLNRMVQVVIVASGAIEIAIGVIWTIFIQLECVDIIVLILGNVLGIVLLTKKLLVVALVRIVV
ncbi:predicted protein [Lodderomyces elongisporus NRRL YB-4239]|uniref:Uncharacterized protein n=1 Tax=Lodderomyces elongisporus (strain ATCC 11503 / CBS 2605 / JCM 1781 / NBRC 1676 / NRRL YB-4239) TaxID=379508 RepID=A5E5B8_LODEL|nr:predicted protein [Lodderomyces elongisporus NRRL YB-4239]